MNFLDQYFYNDLHLWPVYIIVLLIAFQIMAAAIFFHELGHLIYFRYKLNNKTARIRFVFNGLTNWYWEAGEPKDYTNLNKKQYNGIMVAGITIGIFPILFSAYIWFPYLLLIIPYMAGSWSDIKEVYKQVENE